MFIYVLYYFFKNKVTPGARTYNSKFRLCIVFYCLAGTKVDATLSALILVWHARQKITFLSRISSLGHQSLEFATHRDLDLNDPPRLGDDLLNLLCTFKCSLFLKISPTYELVKVEKHVWNFDICDVKWKNFICSSWRRKLKSVKTRFWLSKFNQHTNDYSMGTIQKIIIIINNPLLVIKNCDLRIDKLCSSNKDKPFISCIIKVH